MTGPAKKPHKRIASNRRALRDYFVEERIEAGIELRGTEAKSIRNGNVTLTGSYASIENGQVVLNNLTISPYEFGNRFNHEPARPRQLLLHKREIRKLQVQTDQKGLTLIPLNLYFKRGKVKIELGVCKGKKLVDKRETLKRKDADRDAQRAMAKKR